MHAPPTPGTEHLFDPVLQSSRDPVDPKLFVNIWTDFAFQTFRRLFEQGGISSGPVHAHISNNAKLNDRGEMIREIIGGGAVLDIACGEHSALLLSAYDLGVGEYVGIDIRLPTSVQGKNIILQGDALRTIQQIRRETFSMVFISGFDRMTREDAVVDTYLADLAREIAAVLKPGGAFLLGKCGDKDQVQLLQRTQDAGLVRAADPELDDMAKKDAAYSINSIMSAEDREDPSKVAEAIDARHTMILLRKPQV